MKPPKKSAPPVVEYAGNICATNYWFKLGLMREELAALKQVSQIFKDAKNRTNVNALRLVVTTALLHWDKLKQYARSDQAYCQAEGFAFMEQFREATLRRKYPALKPDRRGAGKQTRKKSGHFFQVCMSKRDQAVLRDIAHSFGMDMRMFINHAIRSLKMEHQEMMETAESNNIKPRELVQLAGCNAGRN